MANGTTDFWPVEIGDAEIVAPIAILRYQASLLGPKTKHLLEAQVASWPDESERFVHSFRIVVPTLDNYRYELFRIRHGVELYPVRILLGDRENNDLNSQEELVEWLKEVLASERTRRVISSLLAQVRS